MRDTTVAMRDRLLRRMYRAPAWFNGALDALVDSLVTPAQDAVRSWRFARGGSSVTVPAPVPVPPGRDRVLIAPMNYAGQGAAWARAITEHIPDAGAVNLTIEFPGDLNFPTDRSVPYLVNRYSRVWQTQEIAHVAAHFTHLLVEAEAPIFGVRFRTRPESERVHFESRGLSVAYMSHGSDLRSPRRHMASTRFSPFFDDDVYVDRVQRRVDRNIAFLEASGAPVFVSTPDLIDDYPRALWVPVVVDVEEWSATRAEHDPARTESDLPLVLHTPSRLAVKGSHLIRGAVTRMAEQGAIRYSEVSGVPSSEIRTQVARADIVLDQFRLGSYGVAACEAMAAGKVVIGHVTPDVRARVREHTGLDLPIVEATPDTLDTVLAELVRSPSQLASAALAGERFVREVHDGRLSASVLERNWIRKA